MFAKLLDIVHLLFYEIANNLISVIARRQNL